VVMPNACIQVYFKISLNICTFRISRLTDISRGFKTGGAINIMRSRKYTFNEREEYFEKINRLNSLKERKHRLYNRFYRRSLIYISTTTLRILFLLFFAWIYFFQGGSFGFSKEIVLSKSEDIYQTQKHITVRKLSLETDVDSYESHFNNTLIPSIYVGDTILIERNLLNKPTFFTHRDWTTKYEIAQNWILYTLIGMLTVISLAFNDGLDPMTDKILWLAWVFNLFAFAHYFLT
jgi:hypothetical protein